MKINLKGWKKIKSDSKHTVLKNSQGHEMKINHSALHPEMQKDLHALPFCDGGDVKHMDNGGNTSSQPQPSSTPAPKTYSPPSGDPQYSGLENNTNTEKRAAVAKGMSSAFAKGGQVKDPTQQHLLSGDKNSNKIEKQLVNKATGRMHYNDGTPQGGASNDVPNSSSEGEDPTLAITSGISTPDQGASVPTPQATPSDASTPPQSLQDAPQAQSNQLQVPQDDQTPTPQPNPAAASLDQSSSLDQATNQQKAGIQQTAQAQGQLGDEQAEVNLQAAQKAQRVGNQYQGKVKEIDDHVDNTIKDIQNDHIKPHQLLDNMGTFDKIKTGIGLILGGIGSGLTGGENPALKMLNQNIERDIDAQKANLGKKQNLLGAYYQQYGNLKDATDMTLITNKTVAAQELQAAADHAQDPLAKANALKAVGELNQQIIPLKQQFAMRQTLASLGSNPTQDNMAQTLGYLRAINPEAAKEVEARYVPGVGTASVPVPEAARTQIISTKNVNDLMNKSLAFAKQPIPNPVTSPEEYAKFKSQGDTLQQQLIGSVKQAQHDGVYKESEAEFLLKQIGDSPASMLRAFTTIPKLQQLQAIKQSEYKNLTDTYGLHGATIPNAQQAQVQSLSPQQQQLVKLAQANPNNVKGQAFLKKLGIQ